MATYNFTTTLTRINGNLPSRAIQVHADLGSNPHPSAEVLFDTTLTDTRRSSVKDLQSITAGFPSFLGDATFANVNVLLINMIPSTSFNDAIYNCYLYFKDGTERIANIWESTATPILDTTWLTEYIPLMPTTTPQESCAKTYAQYLLDLINVLWSDDPSGNQSDINYTITLAHNVVVDLNPTSDITLTAVFSSNNTIDLTIPSTSAILNTYSLGGWCNYVEYTVDNTINEYTWNWAKATATPQTHTYTNAGNFADGVYKCYTSGIYGIQGGSPSDYPAYLPNYTTYLLRTTNADNAIAGLANCVNPNDPAQVAAYNAILAQQTAVQTAWTEFLASENPDPAPVNAAIAELNTLIENSNIVCCSGLTMALAAGTTNQMVLSYPSLPTGTYSNQTGTLTNSLTGEEYTFTGFPANQEDTQLVLNSNTIGAGSSFPDGVWQATVSFLSDNSPYSCTAYALVVTNARCCVRKSQAKSATCKNLTSKAEELNSWLETAIDEFNYAAYSVSNGFIKKINAVCSSCGCGC